MSQAIQTQTVRDLAEIDTGFGTISGGKADLVWEEASENLDEEVTEFVKRVPVSEPHIRTVLKEVSPEAFGL